MNKIIEDSRLKKVMDIIDEINNINDDNSMAELEAQLREITGRNDINASDCLEYWGWISLEELARSFLNPTPEFKGLSDDQLSEIIEKICKCEYSESETDFQLKVLQEETGLSNISNYIFYPDKVGLDINADITEIIAKILADKKK